MTIRSRKGAAPAGVVLMLLAFAAMGGFLYWLSVTAEPSNLAVAEESSDDSAAFAEAVAVSAADFGQDPMAHQGSTVRLSNLPVSGNLGAEAFFVDIPGQAGPYLVKMSPEVVADGLILLTGDVVHITGTVDVMSEDIANEWATAGLIQEGDVMVATFNPSFITATVVELTTATPGGNDSGDTGGQD